ncbi:MAG: MobC family plasmid mobilization relaxosome protein [Acidobacteria bacterium]|nr:MobC family plasmid mobilization relaxosome protein [Acidobacteriota bacterium]
MAAAAAVHVRVRAIACRSRSDSGTPAVAALARPADRWRRPRAWARSWAAAAVKVGRERTRQVARIGNNLNQIARWANTHADKADAFEVIAHLVAIEREIARLAGFGGGQQDARGRSR